MPRKAGRPAAAQSTIDRVRSYYRTILPFYDMEAQDRYDLEFWQALCREWSARSVLELGSGLGRVTSVLAEVSCVVALDVSLEMLMASSRRLAGRAAAHLVAADARRFAFGRRFDLIVAPNDPLSHLTTLPERRSVLRCVAAHLALSGRFVLEGLYRPERAENIVPERPIGKEGTVFLRETWRPVGAHDLWSAHYRYRDCVGARESGVEASFLARAWNPVEAGSIFSSCGLAIETIWGDFARTPFTRGAGRMIVVARGRSASPAFAAGLTDRLR